MDLCEEENCEEDFEVDEDNSDGRESEDGRESGGSVECLATSLFDALAAAQEASERYSLQAEGQPREDYRLAEDFLICSYNSIITGGGWRTSGPSTQQNEVDARFRKGYLCEAVWPGDEEWYPAKIVRVKEWKSKFVVRYRGFSKEDDEEVGEDLLRPRLRNPSRKRRKALKNKESFSPKKQKVEETKDFLEEVHELKKKIDINVEAVKNKFR